MRITMVWRNIIMAGLFAALACSITTPAHVSGGPREVMNECANYLRELKETYQRYRDGEATYQEVERIERIKCRVQWAAFFAAVVAAYCLGKSNGGSPQRFPSLADAFAPDNAIIQIQAERQTGSTCGFHAVLNGQIILDAIQRNVFWTVQQAHDQLTAYQATIAGDRQADPRFGERSADPWLTVHCVERLIDRKPGFALLLQNDSGSVVMDSISGNTLSETIKCFKRAPERRGLAIIINTGAHWIVDVIHKRDGNPYQHVIADSMNWRQTTDGTVQQVIAIERSIDATH